VSGPRARLIALVILIGLAALLRIGGLGRSPLRGDEAFTIRYWAAPPAAILDPAVGLARIEPHPLGAFFTFWAWKALAGETEFAMRLLPALVNLLGVPAMYALGRRLFRDPGIGLAGALLWAISPFLIWHSQDARNYAMWASLSALSLWLLLRATVSRARPADHALYVLACAAAMYVFFLHAFIMIAHGLFVLLCRRERLRAWLGLMLILSVLLIPWGWQAVALAGSGYQGAIIGADAWALWRFYPALAFGETLPQPATETGTLALAGGLLAAYLVTLVLMSIRHRDTAVLCALLALVPLILLWLAATRLDVFNPRYLIGALPGILLPWAFLLASVRRAQSAGARRFTAALGLAALLVPALISLGAYFSPAYRKAPDWFGLRDYLRAAVSAADALIVTAADPASGNIDPAFDYYYDGPAPVTVLPYPGADTDEVVAAALEGRRAVWLVVSGDAAAPVDAALRARGVLISDEGAGESFIVRQYRAPDVVPGEIESPLSLSLGGVRLIGFALTGMPQTGSTLTVLLFWEGQPAPDLTAFLHLIGSPRPDGSTLWAQHDHPPIAPGRDVFAIDLRGVPPGEYTLRVGLYDPQTGARVAITDHTTGTPVGDSFPLKLLTVRP
jgi:4-amino-4-deoxy-L-arabinose transferase-like glycosyltransferase